jgi:hypothetical protein
MVYASLVAISGPKKGSIFRAHPFQWPSKWILPHLINNRDIIVKTSVCMVLQCEKGKVNYCSSGYGGGSGGYGGYGEQIFLMFTLHYTTAKKLIENKLLLPWILGWK